MKKVVTGMFVAMIAVGAMAGIKPVQLSLTPDIAVFDRTETIQGVTLSVWGENPQTSLALGFINGSVGQSAGLSIGLLVNYADSYKGMQWGLVNLTSAEFLGWQDGVLNYTSGSMKGLQTGVVNYAGVLTGLQLGIVNVAADAEGGAQVGLINVIRSNTQWFTEFPGEVAPAMTLVNWRF